MNGRSQMQGDKRLILPKEVNANRSFGDSHWLEIWQNHLCPLMGPNGRSVSMDFEEYCLQHYSTPPPPPSRTLSVVYTVL